jgi:hypothetical protein
MLSIGDLVYFQGAQSNTLGVYVGKKEHVRDDDKYRYKVWWFDTQDHTFENIKELSLFRNLYLKAVERG